MTDHLAVNRANWDERAPSHATSAFYGLQRFRDDPTFLSETVTFDVPRLGDLHGLRGVHLQCHIGTDTLSLARLGATMTGLDFSPAALEQARRLCADTGEAVDFVESTVEDALGVLPAAGFDLVFTGIGALCWLPDIRRWAGVVAALLAPGGRLFIREGHPVLWAADERPDGSIILDATYFEGEGDEYDYPGSYVETGEVFAATRTVSWNHGLGEIVTALLDEGLTITQLVEHQSVPWNALPGLMEPIGEGEYALREKRWRLPMSYTLQAIKA